MYAKIKIDAFAACFFRFYQFSIYLLLSITSAVKGHNSRYSGLAMVRAVDVPGVAAFNCRLTIIYDKDYVTC